MCTSAGRESDNTPVSLGVQILCQSEDRRENRQDERLAQTDRQTERPHITLTDRLHLTIIFYRFI